MKLTDLQYRILGKMRVKPLAGTEIMRSVSYAGSNRAFASTLLRMRDRGLIDCSGEVEAISWELTPAGLSAFLDDERSAHKATESQAK